MAKWEHKINGSFDQVLAMIDSTIMGGSITAELEDSSSFYGKNSRCAVRVYERYSYMGGNRVSMSVTLFQEDGGPVHISAITAGGSQAVFFKLNTFGEEAFLDTLRDALM
ncbi:MAG: hypothetical protein IIW34_06040 [Clostridia bacterium]|nr:hypothetical protein [Clostridia bacterium]